MTRNAPLVSRALLVIGLTVAVMPLAAQVATPRPTPIAPVEVVATRIPESPDKVPASIEVISGASLRDRGVTSLREALSLAAGVAVAPGGDAGPASAVPEMWGLREFDAFLLVVDDIPWGGALNPAVASLSLRDVERVEILRGPAPVTYGATSFVGVIHVVHKASAAKATYLSADGGSFGSGAVAADFALPSVGNWNSRLSADADKQGFQDNRTSFSRGHALFRTSRVDERGKTWLSADLNVLNQDPASPHPREGAGLSTATPLDANYNPRGAYLNEDRLAIFGGFERSILHGATWGTTASYSHSAQRQFRGFLTDISNSANNASGWKENIDINDFYADTHIIWPERHKVRLMTGADLLAAGGEAKGATFTYTAPLSAASAVSVAEPTTLDKDAGNDRMFFGAYASAEWRPTSALNITGGLRLNMTSERRGEGADVTHTRPSGSIGAMYSLWEKGEGHVRAFANYRNTFKPAAFDFSLAENEGVLDPETSSSYEAGLKFRTTDGLVDVEASLFRMDFENLVTATVVNNLPALMNAGSTRFQGVELATDLRLPHDVSARASYSMHDSKFVDFEMAFDGVPTQLAGRRFEMSARTLASAGLTRSPATGFIAHASMNYTGDRFLNKRNSALAPAFSTFDAGIGYRTATMELRIDGRNLGDRRDAVSESEFGDAQYYRMTARSVRAGVVLKY
ncbi:MAG: TonB-dependent receptor [Gemmatimonadaceae bacterium]